MPLPALARFHLGETTVRSRGAKPRRAGAALRRHRAGDRIMMDAPLFFSEPPGPAPQKPALPDAEARALAAAAAGARRALPLRQRGVLVPRRPPPAPRQQRHRQVQGAVADPAVPARRPDQAVAHRARRRRRQAHELEPADGPARAPHGLRVAGIRPRRRGRPAALPHAGRRPPGRGGPAAGGGVVLHRRGRRRRAAAQPGPVADQRAEGGAHEGAPARGPGRPRPGVRDRQGATAAPSTSACSAWASSATTR